MLIVFLILGSTHSRSSWHIWDYRFHITERGRQKWTAWPGSTVHQVQVFSSVKS